MNAREICRTAFPGALLAGSCLAGQAAELTVRLEEPPATGTVAFVLFDAANNFGDLRDPVRVVRRPLDGRPLYRIEDLPPGEYALMVYHDENENGRIDKNYSGVPREPLGFSNLYRPKGPPSYLRAAFGLAEEETRHFDVRLYRPLGKRGRLGAGLGVIARSSPYRDYDSAVYRVIPALSYNGQRLQIYGPNIRFGVVGSGKFRLAATGRYRIGVYEEDESDFLAGLGDRKDTFMAGLTLQLELPGGVDLSARYGHDALDKIGGGEARLELDKSLQFGVFRFSPELGLNWLSSDLSNHDFGVPMGKAAPDRPAYAPGDVFSLEAGMGLFIEITRDWLVILNGGLEFLDDAVTDSPIVSEDYVIKGFGAVNYVF